jgi:hypothetical protein
MACRYQHQMAVEKKKQRKCCYYTSYIAAVVSKSFLFNIIFFLLLSVSVSIKQGDEQQQQQQQHPIPSTSTRLTQTTTTTTTTNVLLYNVSSTTAIQDYLNLLKPQGRNHIVLLKWNSNGILTNILLPKKRDKEWWIQSYYTSTTHSINNIDSSSSINITSKSLYGKVALMYVWDVYNFVFQKPYSIPLIDPPISMLVYTIPQLQQQQQQEEVPIDSSVPTWTTQPHLPKLDSFDDSDYDKTIVTTNIIHIPNPYDYSGANERLVNRLIYKSNNQYLLNMSFDMFHHRSNVIIWRGANHSEAIRTQIVSMSREQQQQQQQQGNNDKSQIWLDAQYSEWTMTDDIALGKLSQEYMAKQYKYHIDVGGCSGTSWSGLRWKMCTGNLVFKIESSMIEWWYSMLIPYKHYIPVKEDLSNLYDQYAYIENNPQVAYNIAQAGQTVCLNTYKAYNARHYMQPILQSLPNATIEQIEEFDILLLQRQQQQKELDSNNT